MCLIQVQKAGTEAMALDDMRQAWQANSDGAGYAFVKGTKAGSKLFVFRSLKLKEFCDAYFADHERYGKLSPFVLHFRFATHGSRGESNIHPFIIAGGSVAVFHNGVLPSPAYGQTGESDTAYFCRSVLGRRMWSEMISRKFTRWLGKLIGPSNRIVLLTKYGDVRIINRRTGIEQSEGVWLSGSLGRVRCSTRAIGYQGGWDKSRYDGVEYDDGLFPGVRPDKPYTPSSIVSAAPSWFQDAKAKQDACDDKPPSRLDLALEYLRSNPGAKIKLQGEEYTCSEADKLEAALQKMEHAERFPEINKTNIHGVNDAAE